MDDVSIEYVKDLVVTQRKIHSEVSLLLKAYPDRRGLSSRSVRRFCLKNAVSKCPAAGQGLKWTKCPAVRNFHRISTERFFQTS